MQKNTNLTIRVNEEEKQKAKLILNDLGLTMSSAINALIKQIIAKEALPFEIDQSNRRRFPIIPAPLSDEEKNILFDYYRKDNLRRNFHYDYNGHRKTHFD